MEIATRFKFHGMKLMEWTMETTRYLIWGSAFRVKVLGLRV